MSGTKQRSRGLSPVLKVALLVGLVAHLIAFVLFRIDDSPLPELAADASFLEFRGASDRGQVSAYEEQAILMDSAPLFIPTRWNATHDWDALRTDLSVASLTPFDPSIDLPGALGLQGPIGLRADTVETPLDTLDLIHWDLFDSFRHDGREVRRMESQPGSARIRPLAARQQTVLHLPMETDGDFGSVRQPPHFSLTVFSDGIVGTPRLLTSSGNDALDQFALAWLQRPETVAQLPKGYLVVEVFPF